MDTVDDVNVDAAWQMVDHVCRHCTSRVQVRSGDDGKTIARCSGNSA